MPGRFPSFQDHTSLERRLQALVADTRRAFARAQQGTLERVTQVTSLVVDGMASHLAAADPHAQYLLRSAATFAPTGESLTPDTIAAAETFTIPAGTQLVVYGTMSIEGILVVKGTLVIL